MPTYEVATRIDAPHDTVWGVLSDVRAWPQRLPTVSSIEALDGAGLRIGSRFAIRQPRLRPTIWVVTAVTESQGFIWCARKPGVFMRAVHEVVGLTADTTLLRLRFSFSGPLGRLAGWLFRDLVRSYIAQEAEAFKECAERRHRA